MFVILHFKINVDFFERAKFGNLGFNICQIYRFYSEGKTLLKKHFRRLEILSNCVTEGRAVGWMRAEAVEEEQA